MNNNMHEWFIYNEFGVASKAAADFLAEHIVTRIEKKNICHVVLPGGNTPADCLSYLAQKKLPWHKIHWYLGDERCYPVGHADRNDVMLDKNLWSQISATNIHRIAAEIGAEQAAKDYADVVNTLECFDIVFIGMGEDGHTASLFPSNSALDDTRSVVPVYDSPKAPDERVSLSITSLKNAHCRMVLTGGVAKAEVIARIRKGESLPINRLGDIHWFLDEAALPNN